MPDKLAHSLRSKTSTHAEARIRAGFILALLVIAALIFLSIRSISGLINNARWVEHTVTALDQINRQDARIEERALLTQRQQAQEQSARNTYKSIGLLASTLSLLLLAIYRVSAEGLRQRNQALQESAQLSLELKQSNDALALKRREADQANELKSEFLDHMSHDLRTPLNAICGFSELLSSETGGPLTEKQKRFLGHIEDGARDLLHLINDITDSPGSKPDSLN